MSFPEHLQSPESQVRPFYTLNPMAMADGRMAVSTQIWFEPERVLKRGSETFQINLDTSGSVRFRDLTGHFLIPYKNPTAAAIYTVIVCRNARTVASHLARRATARPRNDRRHGRSDGT